MANRCWVQPSARPSRSDVPAFSHPLASFDGHHYLFAPLVPPSPSGESFYPKPRFNLFQSNPDLYSLFGYDPSCNPNLSSSRPRWPLPKYILPGCSSSVRFCTQHVGDPNCRDEYNHEIVFYNEGFTVDGEYRNLNDPQFEPFLDSLNGFECPAEFNKPGSHCIVVRGDIELPPDYAEQVKALASFVDPSKPKISSDMRGREVSF